MASRVGWCGQEAIPHSAYGQQVLGMRRVLLDVFTQSHNKIIDGARVGIFVQTPNLFENRLPRDNLAAVANKMPQQFGFHEGQAKYLAMGPQFKRPKIDLFASKGVNVELAQGIGSSRFGDSSFRGRVRKQRAAPVAAA